MKAQIAPPGDNEKKIEENEKKMRSIFERDYLQWLLMILMACNGSQAVRSEKAVFNCNSSPQGPFTFRLAFAHSLQEL